MLTIIIIFFVMCPIALVIISVLLFHKSQDLNILRKKYTPIIDIEKHCVELRERFDIQQAAFQKESNELIAEKNLTIANLQNDIKILIEKRLDTKALIESMMFQENTLKKSIALMKEQDYLIDCGFYEPHYAFGSMIAYERKLKEIGLDEKDLIEKDRAVKSLDSFGMSKEDQKLNKNIKKLVLRAFNGECDAAVAKVDYKNIVTMETRIEKVFSSINKMTEYRSIEISKEYLALKIAELRLVHEFQEKKQKEAEEQRMIKEAMREELKAQAEMEKAKKDAEAEERKYSNELERVRLEIAEATGARQDKLLDKISELEKLLQEAQANKERAISRAQMTKSGHVYIISNIGAFGENVYKIGMTRRLEPMERIDELGSASVPFVFDVHAIIYSEDAPALESELHNKLDPFRINKINLRKEFFKVDLEEISKIVIERNSEIQITRIAEAKEYRQSIALLNKNNSATNNTIKFYCSSCNQKLEVEKDWVGKKLQCPTCNMSVMVPKIDE